MEERSGVKVKGKVLCVECAERSGDGKARTEDLDYNTIYKCDSCKEYFLNR